MTYNRIRLAWDEAERRGLQWRVTDTPGYEDVVAAIERHVRAKLADLGWWEENALHGLPPAWGPWRLYIHDIGHFLEVGIAAATWARHYNLHPGLLTISRRQEPIIHYVIA
jgi:hypothetical protein